MTPEELKASLIEEQKKVIFEIQAKHSEMEKNVIRKDTFEEFKANADKRWAEISATLVKLQAPAPGPSTDPTVRETEHKAAYGKFLRKGLGDLTPTERKVLTIADSTHAGVLAPYEYVMQIIKGITLQHPLRQLATIHQTNAYAVEFPTETAIPAATWIAESTEKTETTGLTYGLTEVKTFEMKMLLKATQKMLEDSAFNLESEIADVAARKCGVLEGTAFYSGDGTSAPEGITINATVLADARSVLTDNTLAFDDFIGTQYQLASPYAKNAAWVLNRSTLGVCVGLKSATTNTYLLQPNLQAGQPAMILGSPVYEWSDFPAIGSTALGTTPGDGGIVLGYGDFRAGYRIVDRIEVNIQRLVEKYIEYGFIGFLVRRRVGGGVVLPEAIQLLKNITT